MDLERIQAELKRLEIDGWLLYDFQGLNPIARDVVGLDDTLITRRWFCMIRPQGQPVWLISRIDAGHFGDAEGEVRTYLSWSSLQQELGRLVAECRNVAVEYVPGGMIPYVSRVDGGTLEMLVETGVELVSSADLIQWCQARWSSSTLGTHLEASTHLTAARELAFESITKALVMGRRITEYDVQQAILGYFDEHGLATSSPPIVAAGRSTGDPHYQPMESGSAKIEEGDVVLVDLWAKLAQPGAVYADITWMAYAGGIIPEELARLFHIVTLARDRAIKFLRDSVRKKETVQGYQVDDVARSVIADAGYGDRYIHRTGHNIGVDDHGTGVNFDNLETHDERIVIPDVCCSIEPGIYLDLFGMRSEVNIFVGEHRAEVTTMPIQRRIVPLMRPSS